MRLRILAATALEDHGGNAASIHHHIDRTMAFDRNCSRVEGYLTNPCIEFESRRSTSEARQRTARPGKIQVLTETSCAQPVVAHATIKPITQAEMLEFSHRARSQTVAAGLIAREGLSVSQDDVQTRAGRPCSRSGSRRARANDENVTNTGHTRDCLGKRGFVRVVIHSPKTLR